MCLYPALSAISFLMPLAKAKCNISKLNDAVDTNK